MEDIPSEKKGHKIRFPFLVIIMIFLSSMVLLPTPILFYIAKDLTYSKDNIVTRESDPEIPGIVFGASVTADKEPSTILKDRLDIAATLFNDGHIGSIILSGNDDTPYNEVSVMKDYLLDTYPYITAEDLVVDGYGYRTYDTCIRAKELLGVTDAILITSGYHLPRSLFVCNNLGIESIGVNSTLTDYEDKERFYFRELFAIDKAVLDIYVIPPEYSNEAYIEDEL